MHQNNSEKFKASSTESLESKKNSSAKDIPHQPHPASQPHSFSKEYDVLRLSIAIVFVKDSQGNK